MKNLLTALTTLTLGTTSGSLTSVLNHEHAKIINLTTDITPNIKHQDTIYVDSNGYLKITSDRDLSILDTTWIYQIGFYQNEEGQIQAVRMPYTVERVPDTLPPQITSLKNMFKEAIAFNQDISNWDTCQITNMSSMFYNAQAFNQDISNWDTSNVTDMSYMFYDASAFNQDLSHWNVEKVTDHSDFANNSGFTTDSSKWPNFSN